MLMTHRPSMTSIKNRLTFTQLNLLSNFNSIKVASPPTTQHTPRNHALSSNSTQPLMQNSRSEAEPVKRIWQPEVALAAVESISIDSRTSIMQVPQPIPKIPCTNPATKAPAITLQNLRLWSNSTSCMILHLRQVANSFLNLMRSRQMQKRVTNAMAAMPMGYQAEHFSTEQKGSLPWNRNEMNSKTRKVSRLWKMSRRCTEFSQVQMACFSAVNSAPSLTYSGSVAIPSFSTPAPLTSSTLIVFSESNVYLPSLSFLFLFNFLNICTKLYTKQEKMSTSSMSCPNFGINVCAVPPSTDPSSEQGITTSSSRQFTSVVFMVGCLRKMTVKKLGSAAPTTKACANPVASSKLQLSAMMSMSILKIPMEMPETLQSDAQRPINRQTSTEQNDSGNTS